MSYPTKNHWDFKISILLLIIILLFNISCSVNSSDRDVSDWKTAPPQYQGLDASILANLDLKIRAGDYGEIHSLLIIRNGFLVYERYYRGYDVNEKHQLFSVTKSFTSALIGIALEQGHIDNLDHNVLSFFPEYEGFENLTPDKEAIVLRNVLTMRMGTHWDEFTYPFDDPRYSVYQIIHSPDWVKYVLDQPMVEPPGTRFRYNTGGTMVLSGILRNSVGKQAQEFADEFLMKPLGIDNYIWETGAQELTNTGWGLWMRPRDMARFGQMYLNGGKWNKKQVVPAAWVETSTFNHVRVNSIFSYGYQWWMMPMDNVAGHVPAPGDIKICWGLGDQFIFVIPDLNMVVVSTAGNFSGENEDSAIEFVPDYIVRAVER
ncbi:MAG: serine hydrolase [Candidatus Zixiibacteriota bacterium]